MTDAPAPLSMNDLSDQVAQLRIRIDKLLSRGTTPDMLADTHQDWADVHHDVDILCAHLTSTTPDAAHSVLDDVREMIAILENIEI